MQGIVVERADGTDSRVIGKGLVPVEHGQVRGGGWSPSGKWLAWKSWRYVGESSSSSQGHIVKADNSRRLTVLEGLDSISRMIWSPSADTLLVVNDIDAAYPSPKGYSFYIINVETGQVLNSFSFDNTPSEDYRFSTYGNWSPNGQYVLVDTTILTTDGRQITLPDIQDGYARWALDSRLIIVDGDNQTLTWRDIEAESETTFSFNAEIGLLWQHPNQQEILVNVGRKLWHIDLETNEATLTQLPNVILYRDYEAPELKNNQIILSAQGSRFLYDFNTHQGFILADRIDSYVVSASGRYILYRRKNLNNDNYQAWIFDTQTHIRHFIEYAKEPRWNCYREYWYDCSHHFSPDETYVLFSGLERILVWDTQSQTLIHTNLASDGFYLPIHWADNQRFLVKSTNSDIDGLWLYNIPVQTSNFIAEYKGSRGASSVDGQHFIFEGMCPLATALEPIFEPLCVHNFATNTFTALIPHNLYRGHSIYSFWHPNQNWVHIGYEFGSALHVHSVHSGDGRVARDLPAECGSQEMCCSWVPDYIDVDAVMQPPQDILTEPTIRLRTPGRVTALAYNKDGTQLAAAFTTYAIDEGQANDIQVWDIKTETPLYTIIAPYEYIGGLAWVDNDTHFVVIAKTIEPELQLRITNQDDSELRKIEPLVAVRDSQDGKNLHIFPQDGIVWILDILWSLSVPIDTELLIPSFFSTQPFTSQEAINSRNDIWGISFIDNRVQKFTGWPYLAPHPNQHAVFYINIENELLTLHEVALEKITDNILRQAEFPPTYASFATREVFQHGAIAPNGQWYALSSHTLAGASQTLVWDIETGKFYTNYPTTALALEFSPDSEQLALAARNEVLIWDVQPSPLILDKITPSPFASTRH